MRALDWRRAAAKELERMSELHDRLDRRLSEAKLLRDRIFTLNIDLRDTTLDHAITLLDEVAMRLTAAKRRFDDAK